MRIRAIVAAALVVVGGMAVSPASAQYVGGTPPSAGAVVKPVPAAPTSATPVKVQTGGSTQAARPRSFPVTGADIVQMVLIGGAFLVGGTFLVRRSRRRAAFPS